MKRWYLMLFFALSTILATSRAGLTQETIDMAKVTCDQFLAGKVADSRSLTVWLSGYYHGMHNNTLLDVNGLQQNAQTVMDYCISHPSVTLMDAATTLIGKQK